MKLLALHFSPIVKSNGEIGFIWRCVSNYNFSTLILWRYMFNRSASIKNLLDLCL